jgi:hypothetical protein
MSRVDGTSSALREQLPKHGKPDRFVHRKRFRLHEPYTISTRRLSGLVLPDRVVRKNSCTRDIRYSFPFHFLTINRYDRTGNYKKKIVLPVPVTHKRHTNVRVNCSSV